MYVRVAIFLYTIVHDPMLLSCVSVLAVDDSPDDQVQWPKAYVKSAYDAYLTLYRNSSKHRVHEFQLPD